MLHSVLAGDHILRPTPDARSGAAAPVDVVPAAAVRDADPTATPPEVRTVTGETLFFPADRKNELEGFCRSHGIPLVSRPDVWGDLLEPFLDTEFTPRRRAATAQALSRVGLDEAAVADIRAEVGPLVLAYNSLHWEWCYLGLADLLDAATGGSTTEPYRIGPDRFPAFCAWAMAIADLGHVPGTPVPVR
ncbi:hypothetical protein [Kitasatospora purpeofusca]|uniref:hypothetical protein n=1 Tax=Kitasatospora purpeofusca TaxID=67352 RepID=UPI000689907A|nr:hypothetical protein [Kitasatospora purpeofusca]